MIKAIISASLILLGLVGFILAGSDGPHFPIINLFGLIMLFASVNIYLKIKNEIF